MKERKLNIDILKCIAIVFVVAVHFFLHTNYYGRSYTYKSIFFIIFYLDDFYDLCSHIYYDYRLFNER